MPHTIAPRYRNWHINIPDVELRREKKKKKNSVAVCVARVSDPREVFFEIGLKKMESLLCYDPFRVVRGVDENLPPAVSSTNNIALHKQTRGISLDQWQRESLRVLLETPRGFNVLRLVHVNSNHSCGFYRSASVVYVEKVAVDCVDIIRLCSWKFVGNPKRIKQFSESILLAVR